MCVRPKSDAQPIGLRHRSHGSSLGTGESPSSSSGSEDVGGSSPSSSVLGSSPSGRELKKTRSFLRVVEAVKPQFDARRAMRRIHDDAVVLKSIWL